jgi:hypothetical protein
MQHQTEPDRITRITEWVQSLQQAIAQQAARKLRVGERRCLTSLDLGVAVALASHFDEDLRCARSHESIAADIGCSDTTARTSTKRLIASGFLREVANGWAPTSPLGGRPTLAYAATLPSGRNGRAG